MKHKIMCGNKKAILKIVDAKGHVKIFCGKCHKLVLDIEARIK